MKAHLSFYSGAAFAKAQRCNDSIQSVTHAVELIMTNNYAAHAGERAYQTYADT
jgi:hypothetical protein